MTRFARAKGSKASNQRVPEEATSWSEIKQQLEAKQKEISESKERQNAINQRNENYKAFLEEKADAEWKETKWAEFPGVKKPKNESKVDKNKKTEKLRLGAMEAEISDVKNDDLKPEEISSKIPPKEIQVKKAKNKKKPLKIVVDINDNKTEKSNDTSPKNVVNDEKKLKKKERRKAKKAQLAAEKAAENKEPEKKTFRDKAPEELTEKDLKILAKKKERRARQKEKRKLFQEAQKQGKDIPDNTKSQKDEKVVNKKKPESELTEEEKKRIAKKKEKLARQAEKRKMFKEKKALEENISNNIDSNQTKDKGEHFENISRNFDNRNKSFETKNKNFDNRNTNIDNQNNFESNNKFEKGQKRNGFSSPNKQSKRQKFDNGEKPNRKKPSLPTKMMINGKEVEIDYVDGFPVKKEDAERLKQLRKEMISKGLPRSEIAVALKLERRKAEKAFAREKKKVCFNCRKSGHNLSECPELNKDELAQETGTGICFKCGSTEHSSFECRVVKGQEFKFATCFICNEQGHISRQCPDNARGLYPKGGACNVCGDVTHLKKDCPKYLAQQEHLKNNLEIGTINGGNPDDLDGDNGVKSAAKNRPNKINFLKTTS